MFEPQVFCEAHGREEIAKIGVRWPESWECCSSLWDRNHTSKTVVTVVSDEGRRCQTCYAAEIDAEFQKTLAMLEAL
jgi:hypothetical protein